MAPPLLFVGQRDLDEPNALGRQGAGATLPLGQFN